MANPETINSTPEQQLDATELQEMSNERNEVLRNSLEEAERAHKEKIASKEETISEITKEATDQAVESGKNTTPSETAPAKRRSFFNREASFKKHMDAVQHDLSPSERRFSRLIHHKTIEQASDALGSTLARPNALFAGSVAAFIIVTAVYVIAKYYGYPLSGFEMIGSFVIGWIIGLIYDYVHLLVVGKNKS